ncbi:MAG: pyridoxamine 5'-phosphate oxidase family protein [Actinomycetota bacterium]|jgi:nitroimidazol reductase NimA-like FMN-containing flavoprotein (pyridoxamine 5'-phosphate oxidase superfamily)|nr:pyridoxamine 5'-phosphate oxidase family protein [Actinomycetota bacterium]
MTDHPDNGELVELEEDESWALVRSRKVGRFAANRPGLSPLVVPVNYVVADGEIVFRSGAGTKLSSTSLGLVAIQVDDIDPNRHVGWSVQVEGLASWLYEEQDDTTVETWAPGERPYVIRLRPTRITGRRIRFEQPDTDGRGYR